VKKLVDVNKTFYTRVAQANIMPDGMMSEVSYGDFALMMVAKNRPVEPRKIRKNNNINS
jgi:hypothetical protein